MTSCKRKRAGQVGVIKKWVLQNSLERNLFCKSAFGGFVAGQGGATGQWWSGLQTGRLFSTFEIHPTPYTNPSYVGIPLFGFREFLQSQPGKLCWSFGAEPWFVFLSDSFVASLHFLGQRTDTVLTATH